MEVLEFRYEARCTHAGCDKTAVYKVAAIWSNGTSREVKNYGLACDEHQLSQVAHARFHRDQVTLAEGESIGEIGLYVLEPGRRDVELRRLPEVNT